VSKPRREPRTAVRPKLIFVLVALLALEPPAIAQELPNASTAEWIMPGCRGLVGTGDANDLRRGICAGSIGTLLFLGDALPDDYRVCRPRGAVLDDAVRIVVTHIERQPRRLHENFNGLAMEALSAAWPCP
jgi:hypothetical protein